MLEPSWLSNDFLGLNRRQHDHKILLSALTNSIAIINIMQIPWICLFYGNERHICNPPVDSI